jgi:NDP-sugar pyrophosphorylase family protein
MNGDLLTTVAINEMMSFHDFERNIITIGTKQTQIDIPYGVINTEGTRVTGLSEKPIYNFSVSAGIYVIDSLVIDRLPDGQPYDMTDAINNILDSKLRVGSFPIYEYWQDIGQPHELEKARKEYDDHFSTNDAQ